LEVILRQGEANGVPALSIAPGREVRRVEPNVQATAAIWSPDTGIVDVHAFMESLLASARPNACDVAFRHSLVAAEPRAGGHALRVADARGEQSSVLAGAVVNCAGLACDEVAAAAGVDVDAAGYRLSYVK